MNLTIVALLTTNLKIEIRPQQTEVKEEERSFRAIKQAEEEREERDG